MPDFGREVEALIRARYPIVYAVTWEEARLERDLLEVAQRLKKDLLSWTITVGFQRLPDGKPESGTTDPLRALSYVLESKDNCLFLLKDFDPYLTDPTLVRRLRDVARELKTSYKSVLICSPVLRIPDHLEKDITVLDYDLPTRDDVRALLERIVDQVKSNPRITIDLQEADKESLVNAALGLTTQEAENVFAKAVVVDSALTASDVAIVLAEKQQIIRKSGLLEYYAADEQFGDVGGLELLKDWLRKRGHAFSERARQFGLPYPKGALLLGVQGCGKSLCAKAVSGLWNLPLLRLDVGALFSGIVGSSEQNVRRAVRVAESISPCILWLDELEKGFSGVKSSDASDSGTTARVFGSFIQWMQEKTKPVFVIATANDVQALPPELLRKGRFDEIFFVDLPDDEDRADIFDIHLRKRDRNPESFNLPDLARAADGFSGAEIEEAVVSALYDAFDAERDLTQEDLSTSIAATVPLSTTMRERLQELRSWAQSRARPASAGASTGGLDGIRKMEL
jgi:ATP-dependent 26S proteasome regulatory subunit